MSIIYRCVKPLKRDKNEVQNEIKRSRRAAHNYIALNPKDTWEAKVSTE